MLGLARVWGIWKGMTLCPLGRSGTRDHDDLCLILQRINKGRSINHLRTTDSSTCNSLYTASCKVRELLLVSRCLMCTRNCPPRHLHESAATTLHSPWSVGATKRSQYWEERSDSFAITGALGVVGICGAFYKRV